MADVAAVLQAPVLDMSRPCARGAALTASRDNSGSMMRGLGITKVCCKRMHVACSKGESEAHANPRIQRMMSHFVGDHHGRVAVHRDKKHICAKVSILAMAKEYETVVSRRLKKMVCI